ncbi:hypothetical protein L1887_03400 [Cichorium endivia]|nr:hypothetical protein L1887_03400 [Cichorium endivia]
MNATADEGVNLKNSNVNKVVVEENVTVDEGVTAKDSKVNEDVVEENENVYEGIVGDIPNTDVVNEHTSGENSNMDKGKAMENPGNWGRGIMFKMQSMIFEYCDHFFGDQYEQQQDNEEVDFGDQSEEDNEELEYGHQSEEDIEELDIGKQIDKDDE